MDSDLNDMQAETPTTLTTAEDEADSPQNPEEESPAGNPNARLPLPEEESPTLLPTTESEADSPWSPEESSPAGNPHVRLPLQTR